MKKALCLFFATALQLCAAPLLYEGFDPDQSKRTGWMSGWHPMAGEVAHAVHGLGMPGLEAAPGALRLTKKGEALAQHKVDFEGTYYGAFRVHVDEIKRDSLIALLLARPDLGELNPKTANVSLMLKGWRLDHGVLLSEGKTVKTEQGAPIQAKQTYLALFKVENEAPARSIQMWILNKDQVLYHSNRSISEEALNAASMSNNESDVMQRLYLEPKKDAKIGLSAGSVVACVAKFCPKVVFDEIRISELSLADAANAPAE